MDGLDRLIEMLEKRFGKFWADGLLLIVVLGAAAWAIHTLCVDLLVPGYDLISPYVNRLAGFHLPTLPPSGHSKFIRVHQEQERRTAVERK